VGRSATLRRPQTGVQSNARASLLHRSDLANDARHPARERSLIFVAVARGPGRTAGFTDPPAPHGKACRTGALAEPERRWRLAPRGTAFAVLRSTLERARGCLRKQEQWPAGP
jgi:hypothetical protein